jgi:hypothetical protein
MTSVPSPFNRPALWAKDTAERVLSSGAEAVSALLVAGAFNLVDVHSWAALAVAAGTAALATFVKSLVAKNIGNPDSASLNPRV